MRILSKVENKDNFRRRRLFHRCRRRYENRSMVRAMGQSLNDPFMVSCTQLLL